MRGAIRARVVRIGGAVAVAAASVVGIGAAPAAAAPAVERISGTDRFDTAAKLSAAAFDPGVATAFVANGGGFADALAGGAAAAKAGGPVLLVTRDTVPPATAAELRRLAPQRIAVLGGPAVVTDQVVAQLRSFTSGSVDRLAGADRYETAARISQATFPPATELAFLATGTGFADALGAGAVAGAFGAPVLLTSPTQIPAAVQSELRRLAPQRIVVVGGRNAVGSAVEQQLASFSSSVVRIAGADRYATAASLSFEGFESAATVFVATGTSFADALAAGPVAATSGSLLLVPGSCVPSTVQAEIDRLGATTAVIVGGPGAVGPGVESFTPCPDAPDPNDRVAPGTPAPTGDAGPQPSPAAGSDVQALEEYQVTVAEDVDAYWTVAFQGSGLTYDSPGLVLTRPGTTTQSPCGPSGDPAEGPDLSPAFYCFPNSTIYLSDSWMQRDVLGTRGPAAVAVVISHEFGHHVQQELGLIDAQGRDCCGADTRVRELQADCFAGTWGNSAYGRGQLDDEDIEAATAFSFESGGGDHGTPEERASWFSTGFRWGDPGLCDPQ